MIDEMLPCPFCAHSKVWVVRLEGRPYVECTFCGARGPKENEFNCDQWNARQKIVVPAGKDGLIDFVGTTPALLYPWVVSINKHNIAKFKFYLDAECYLRDRHRRPNLSINAINELARGGIINLIPGWQRAGVPQ